MVHPGTTDRQRARTAERQRRYRVRRQTAVLLTVELERFWFTEALIEAGRLGQWDENNRGATEAAVTRLLEDWQITVTRDGVDPVASFTVRPGDSDDHRRIRNEGEMKSFPASLNIWVPEGIDKAVEKVAVREGKDGERIHAQRCLRGPPRARGRPGVQQRRPRGMTQMNGHNPAEHAAIPPPPPGFVLETPAAPDPLQAMPPADLKHLVSDAVDEALSNYTQPVAEVKPSGSNAAGTLTGRLSAHFLAGGFGVIRATERGAGQPKRLRPVLRARRAFGC